MNPEIDPSPTYMSWFSDQGLDKGDTKGKEIQVITKDPPWWALARRAGVKRIADLVYEETRSVLKTFVESLRQEGAKLRACPQPLTHTDTHTNKNNRTRKQAGPVCMFIKKRPSHTMKNQALALLCFLDKMIRVP